MNEFPAWFQKLLKSLSTIPRNESGDVPYDVDGIDQSSPPANDREPISHHPSDDKIRAFIEEHFEFTREEEECKFFKFGEIQLSERQMTELIKIMRERWYGGEMHAKEYVPTRETNAKKYWESFKVAMSQNLLNPAALGYQVVNLLPVTAYFTWRWKVDPEYRPSAWEFAIFGISSLVVMRNNHFYAAVTKGFSRDEFEACDKRIKAEHEQLDAELQRVILNSDDETGQHRELLLSKLRTFGWIKRVDMTVRVFIAAFFLTMFGALALAKLDVFQSLSACAKLMVGVLLALVPGVSMAFSVVMRVGGQNRSIREFSLERIIPPARTAELAYFFADFANFAPIPWTMALIGPAMWAAVRFKAAVAELELLGVNVVLNSNSTANFTLDDFNDNAESVSPFHVAIGGYYAITAISAVFASEVFKRYNVDENFSKELPTKRTFELMSGSSLNRAGQTLLASTLVAGSAAYGAHLAGMNEIKSGLIGVGAATFSTALFNSKKFQDIYLGFFQFLFVSKAFLYLDGLHKTDKWLLSAAGAASTGFGIYKDNEIATAIGMATLFLSVTGLIADYSSRMNANITRYMVSQTLLYSAAFLTWIFNFVLPMMNIAMDRSPSAHPTELDESYFGVPGKIALAVVSVLLGVGAARADAKATLEKVSGLTGEIPVGSRFVAVWNKFRRSCCGEETEEASNESSPLSVGSYSRFGSVA